MPHTARARQMERQLSAAAVSRRQMEQQLSAAAGKRCLHEKNETIMIAILVYCTCNWYTPAKKLVHSVKKPDAGRQRKPAKRQNADRCES